MGGGGGRVRTSFTTGSTFRTRRSSSPAAHRARTKLRNWMYLWWCCCCSLSEPGAGGCKRARRAAKKNATQGWVSGSALRLAVRSKTTCVCVCHHTPTTPQCSSVAPWSLSRPSRDFDHPPPPTQQISAPTTPHKTLRNRSVCGRCQSATQARGRGGGGGGGASRQGGTNTNT
jgi:hypothetical protein